jgi:hypothetical protein
MPHLDDPLVQRRIARWRKVIIKSWQRQVGAIVATGRLLLRAHHDLIETHGAWRALVVNELPFTEATAQKLMAIARHPTLSRYSTWNTLPASWTTLYQLSLIPAPQLEQLRTDGTVNRDMTVAQAVDLRERSSRGDSLESLTEVERITAHVASTVTAAIVRLEQLIDDEITRDEMIYVRDKFNDTIATMMGFTADLQTAMDAEETQQ